MSIVKFEETGGKALITLPLDILEKANFTKEDEYEVVTYGESISIVKKTNHTEPDSDWIMSGTDSD